MSLPYTAEMMESIKKVEAGRAARIGFEPRRMTADEKTALLQAFHPDYNIDSFEEIKVGPNAGQKAPKELVEILQGESRIKGKDIDIYICNGYTGNIILKTLEGTMKMIGSFLKTEYKKLLHRLINR